MLSALCNHSAETMEMIPIRFVIEIAEHRVDDARVTDQGDVEHFAGIMSIERTGNHCFVGGEDCRIYPDAKRQGKHRDQGERKIAR